MEDVTGRQRALASGLGTELVDDREVVFLFDLHAPRIDGQKADHLVGTLHFDRKGIALCQGPGLHQLAKLEGRLPAVRLAVQNPEERMVIRLLQIVALPMKVQGQHGDRVGQKRNAAEHGGVLQGLLGRDERTALRHASAAQHLHQLGIVHPLEQTTIGTGLHPGGGRCGRSRRPATAQ